MSRINSARQPLFAIAVPIWQGIRESLGSHLPRAELLRRTVPVLIAIFASLGAIWLVCQTLPARLVAGCDRPSLSAPSVEAVGIRARRRTAGADGRLDRGASQGRIAEA